MARHLDLRSGRPVWTANGMPRIPASPLDGDGAADVAIVGGGVSGALVADALLQAGLTVIAIDRREFGGVPRRPARPCWPPSSTGR